jgi:dienelactone hydrolase
VQVKAEELFRDADFTATRMSFEILEGVKLTGVLLKKGSGRRPLVIVQHGAQGSPELVSGFYETTSNYNGLAERLFKYDVNIFAPQLLLWNGEEHGVPFNRAVMDAKLKRVGSSITAVEMFGLMRILDYFQKQDYVKNFGMAGLSYGAYYTMLMSAIDTRIESAVSCSFFCGGNVLREFCDIHFFDIGNRMSWAEIMMLVYPRQICLAIGDKDIGFPYRESEKEYERLKALCEAVGTDWADFFVFDGGHEFFTHDEPLMRLAEQLNGNLGDYKE